MSQVFMKQVRVGLFTDSVDGKITGPGNYLSNLARALLQVRGDEDIAFIHYRQTGNPIYKEVDEIVTSRLPFLQEMDLRRHSFDVIHYNLPPHKNPFWLVPAKKIVTIYGLQHSALPWLKPKRRRWVQNLVWPFLLRKFDAVITISDASKDLIHKHLRVPQSKIARIYGGVGPAFRAMDSVKAREYVEAQFDLVSLYILHVNNYSPRKNPLALFRAFEKVRRENKYKLVVVGRRWDNVAVKRLVQELDLTEDVVFLGYVNSKNLPFLYNAAALYVYPSFYEGFGLSLLEAMACGCPVVSANVYSIPEVVGDAALLVSAPGDFEELAELMYRALTDNSLRAEMVDKGLRQAAGFSWEKCARETLDVYKKIMSHEKALTS
jgi:glycosyltransferase involved in cell wall biosynthesis